MTILSEFTKHKVHDWCKETHLKVNPEKTDSLLLESGRST